VGADPCLTNLLPKILFRSRRWWVWCRAGSPPANPNVTPPACAFKRTFPLGSLPVSRRRASALGFWGEFRLRVWRSVISWVVLLLRVAWGVQNFQNFSFHPLLQYAAPNQPFFRVRGLHCFQLSASSPSQRFLPHLLFSRSFPCALF